MSQIVWSIVGCAAVYLLKRFADTLCYFSIGSILNDRMSTYAETPFASAYIRNLGKASVYSVVYVPIVFFDRRLYRRTLLVPLLLPFVLRQ